MGCSQGVILLFLALLLTIQPKFGCCRTDHSDLNVVSCIVSEREALLNLKKGLSDGANRLSSWHGEDCCAWEGVGCNKRTGHVIKLNLSNPVAFEADRYFDEKEYSAHFGRNCLGGKISPSLLNLNRLQYLDLSMNNFSGMQIPEFFGSFKNLEYLNLSSAGFGGKMPENLGNLTNLQYLHIGYAPSVTYSYHFAVGGYGLNVVSLSWVAELSSLKTLDLSGVELREIHDWLHSVNMIPSLVSLSLAGCGLDAFPPVSSVNFTSLLSLNLQWNSFNSTIPPWIYNVTSLQQLYLDHNSFNTFFPENFERLASLSVLDLSSNFFKIPLPNSLCKLKNLVLMDVSFNNFEGVVPDCLNNLTSLTILNLASNALKGPIPDSVMNLCSLQVLDLSFNQFSSVLPAVPSGCLCNSLKELYFISNGFHGYFPSELEKYNNLEVLHLSFNSFSGTIPFELGRLLNLRELDLSNNNFNGSFPSSLGQLAQLVKLDISNNSLDGVISEIHFEKLTKLTDLSVSLNSFLVRVNPVWIPPFQLKTIELASINAGTQFPPWLQTQKQVKRLIMSSASISGPIPSWFEKVYSQINDLDLSKNNISGKLPAFEESHGYLRVIKLNSNKFEGPITSIPRQLYLLDLSENLLEGPLSLDGIYLNMSLNQLILSHNSLTGDIPEHLCDIQSLSLINLSGNKLSGMIPSCFSKLKNLSVLDLSNNSLNGQIPSSLGFLSGLNALHLQQNKLDGKIPSSFRNLKGLHILNLGDNEFEDTIPPWIGEEVQELVYLRIHSNNFYGGIPSQLCQLKFLRFLNLANNSLSGSIPHCVNNLRSMISDPPEMFIGMRVLYYYERTIVESTKGAEREYSTPLPHLISIVLSDNQLSGEIPEEIMDLKGLINLNLSGNHLIGMIPGEIGNLQQLDSLDLSRNELSGQIPPGLSTISRLSYLNLSFNNLSGPIPTGNQLQTFDDPSVYQGNIGLCGAPLPKSCPDERSPNRGEHEREMDGENKFEYLWFYAGIGPGFGFGFGFACCIILVEACRAALLRFSERLINCFKCRNCT